MTEPAFWVIGNATAEAWLLSTEPYPTEARAQRAVNWQLIGERDPPEYWRIVTTDELRQLIPTMCQSPYTNEAWAKVKAKIQA